MKAKEECLMRHLLDRMCRKRNDAFYDIALITLSEAEEAVATAENYLV
jgi:hypothetical protein